MGFVEGLALSVSALILLETVVFLIAPGWILDFSETMANYEMTLMMFYMVLGAILMYFLLRSYSLVEIMACGSVIAIFYGVALLPFYGSIVEQVQDDYEEGRLWNRIGPGLLLWVGLSFGVIFQWWMG